MKRILFGGLAFVAGVALITSPVVSQPPDGKGGKEGKQGKDGMGKGGRFELGMLIPPPLEAEMNLTPDQVKKLAQLKGEVKAKLEKILTPAQLKMVEEFQPMRKGGEKGGKGGDKGGDKGDRPDRPPFDKND